jgi:hypothetical protein
MHATMIVSFNRIENVISVEIAFGFWEQSDQTLDRL